MGASWAPLVLLAAAAVAGKKKSHRDALQPKRSVLWLLVDDFRPQTAFYGQGETTTPRLDALAASGVVFDRAYCQVTVCAPSRNSFFTGRRPDALRVYNFVDHFRSTTPDAVPLPEYFKNNGYVTLGAGKTYQPGKPPDYDIGRSWSTELPYLPLDKNLTRCSERNARTGRFLDVCPEERAPRDFMDTRTADYAIEAIGVAGKVRRPYFVVAGFYRPHLRWHVPAEHYAPYAARRLAVPERSRRKPKDMPDIAWANEGCHTMTTREHGTVTVSMDRPLKKALAEELRRGYYACVSWIDALAGRVLDAASDDAIVVLSSDHGFHLGEQASWTKHTLFEIGSRVPLVIRAPGVAPGRTAAFAELTDLYRTFADLAGLTPPAPGVQGASLARVLRSPDVARVRNFSLTQYPRCPRDFRKAWDANCKRLTAAEIPAMGYSLRVNNFRFTEWYRWKLDADGPRGLDPPKKVVDRGVAPVATELYALDDSEGARGDYDALELANVAAEPAAACVVKNLRKALALLVDVCQAKDDAACDDRVDALAAAGATCVDDRTRASFRDAF